MCGGRDCGPSFTTRTHDANRERLTVDCIVSRSFFEAFACNHGHMPAIEFHSREAVFRRVEAAKNKNGPCFPLLDGVGRSQFYELQIRLVKRRALIFAATEFANGEGLRESGRRYQKKCEPEQSRYNRGMKSHRESEFPAFSNLAHQSYRAVFSLIEC